jgi:hypothetical protein
MTSRFIVKSDKGSPFFSVEDSAVTKEIGKEGHWKCIGAYLTYDQAVSIAMTLNYVSEMK